MSGIAGIVYPDNFPVANLIVPMLNTMKHRGLPIRSEHTYRKIQVGVCGSTIAGKNNVIAGLDGRFYNGLALRSELKKHGYKFEEESDTEILVHGYDFWGTALLEHLQGDFAFFILDKNHEKILIARDRIGKKPLYWFRNDHYFGFASELKALLATGAVPQAIAPDGIAAYLYFGFIPQDMSPIKDVNKLLPSHYLLFNRNRSETIQSYWSYSNYFQASKTPQSAVEDVDALLQDSIKQRIPENKPLGCLVAGGLGSASVAHYLRKFLEPEQIHALTVEFQDENTQDTNAAKEFAQHEGIPHHCGLITPNNFLDDMVKIAWHLDEPIADPHVVSTWKLAQAAKPLGTFFSGMGSDELLAGHSRYTVAERKAAFSDRMLQAGMPLIKSCLLPLLNNLYQPAVYKILKQTRTNPWQIDFLQHNALFTADISKAAAPEIAHLFDPHVFLHKFHKLPQIKSTVASFLYLDVKTRLADCYILQYERLMSANGIDWRTPFLAEPLVEYLAGLAEPDTLQENETFCILKALLKNAFPKTLIERPKKTRKHFLKAWSEKSDLNELFQILPRGTLVETGLISRKWLNAQLSSPQSRRESFRFLWSLLALEIWFHLFINHPIQATSGDMSVRQLLTSE